MRIQYLLLLCLLLACGGDYGTPSYPYRAKIVTSTAQGYRWEVVTFETIENFRHLRGRYGDVVGQSDLEITNNFEDIIESENPEHIFKNRGHKIRLDYKLEKKIAMPTSFASLEMLTLYHHFEQIAKVWEERFGLGPEQLGRPRLHYNPTISIRDRLSSIEVQTRLNAAFIPGVREFLFMKTSTIEQIPLKMNRAVIAHEFAHGIFDYQVAQKDIKFYESKNDEAKIQLSGMNEGLADYFSWMITGNNKEFGASLAQLGDYRNLPVAWTSKKLKDNKTLCLGGFYCKGSILASSLYESATTISGFDRFTVGKTLFNALGKFRDDWLNFRENGDFDYYYLLVRILNEDPPHKMDYCTIFRKWFDDDVNLPKLEAACSAPAS